MFDDSSYKKTGRLFAESVENLSRQFSGSWDDKVFESFQNYLRFCSQQCQEVESIVKEISGVCEDLNDLRADSIISDAEMYSSNVEGRYGKGKN